MRMEVPSYLMYETVVHALNNANRIPATRMVNALTSGTHSIVTARVPSSGASVNTVSNLPVWHENIEYILKKLFLCQT